MYIALNASAKLTGIVGVGVTTVPVTAGTGSQFAVGSNHSYVTFQNAAGTKETCKITGQSGDNLTVVRTKSVSWAIGDVIECRPCAEAMADYAVAPQINGSSAVAIADADEVGFVDASAANILAKITWANVKATLKTYFDTLYTTIAAVMAAIQGQTATAFTTAGSSTAYTLAPSPAITANMAGLRFRITFNAAAGATPTLAVSGQTAKSLKYKDSAGTKQAITSVQVPINWVSDVEYDGTDWVVLNVCGVVSGGGKVQDFVLTLESGVPISTADQLAKTTIYCTPYKGNQIALYDGSSTWNVLSSAEFSRALGTLTASLPYDVFCYDNAGTPALEFLAWTSATARATALVMQDGVLVKSGATTRRYLGTFYTASTTTTADAAATRYLWNYYHQKDKKLSGTFSADRTTTSTTYAEINNEIQIKWVIGVSEEPMRFYVSGSGYNSSANYGQATAIGIDSTTTATAGLEVSSGGTGGVPQAQVVSGEVIPSIGYHYATLLGRTQGGTAKWFSTSGTETTETLAKVYLTAVDKR